ncbi:hypothetical protein C0V97_05860 [Asaia sp. W19]|nr:hypothetical protein C0V97_05860 [Asaia sp. W19]
MKLPNSWVKHPFPSLNRHDKTSVCRIRAARLDACPGLDPGPTSPERSLSAPCGFLSFLSSEIKEV